jgi:PAS domain S-box-containing protein
MRAGSVLAGFSRPSVSFISRKIEMVEKQRAYLSPPVQDSEEKTQRASLLLAISLIALLLSLCFSLLYPFLPRYAAWRWVAMVISALPSLSALWLLRRGRVRLASILFVVLLWLAVTLYAAFVGGIQSASFTIYTLAMLSAGILFGWHVGFFVAALTLVVGFVLTFARAHDVLPVQLVASTPVSAGLAYATGLGGVVLLLYRVTRITERTLLRAQRNERALAQSYRELEAEIAERKRVEQTSRERGQYLEQVLAAAPDAIITLDAQHSVVEWNPGAEELFGYTREEAIGRNVDELITTSDTREEAMRLTQTVASKKDVGPVTRVRYRKDGSPVDVMLSGAPIFVDENLMGMVAIYTDISDRVNAEKEERLLFNRMQRQQATLVRLLTDPSLVEGRLEEALHAIAAAAADTLGVERANVWRLSASGRELRCLASVDLGADHPSLEPVLVVEQYPRFFRALGAGRIVDVSDVRADQRTSELAQGRWTPLGIQASLSAPVHRRGQVVGLVCHDHRGGKRAWTADEVTFAGQIADLVAQVFLNADLRRRTDELAAITRVSREITSVPDLGRVFRSIARHAAELSHSDASGVFAFRPDGRLYVEAGYGVGEAFLEAINRHGIELGTGAIGRASAARKAVQITDTWSDPDYKYNHIARLENTRGVLAVPMIRGDETIGGIVLWHRQPRHFSSEEVAFLRALAQQCVNAVENVRLLEAEARRRREAETLRAATQALSATLDLPELLELILSELQKVVPYDSASVQQLLGGQLEIIGGRGFPNLNELLGVCFDPRADDNPNGRVLRARKPLILGDAPEVYAEFHRDPHGQANIRSWLGVPLLLGDRVIGMIALDKRESGFYTQEHARMAQAFAPQAAIAIENARVFAQEEQRATALANALEQRGELDRLKDEFIQNVSHELRTPLGLIQGYSELLDQGELGGLRPEQLEPVAIIARRARMLGKLVQNLTAILETETQQSKRETIDLGALVTDLVADFQVVAGQAGLTLRAEVPPGLPTVFGDRTHLHRVLDNLLGNAIKFTASGGEICARLSRENESLFLQVVDTGVGIPQDQLHRVFERFYQVDGSMSRRYGGAGLGLALVKEIVEAHHGRVRVASVLGQGTTFTVQLPVHPD